MIHQTLFLGALAIGTLGTVAAISTNDTTPMTQEVGKYRNIYFGAEINEKSIHSLVDILNNATTNDTFTITMSTPGGEAQSGWDLILAIQNTKAKIDINVNNYSSSMGAIIMCGNINRLTIADDALILFHTMQYSGKAMTLADVKKLDDYEQRVFNKIKSYITKNCRYIFTDTEWNQMWNEGKDITYTGKEFKERMAKGEK